METTDKEFGGAMGALFHQIITDMKVFNSNLFCASCVYERERVCRCGRSNSNGIGVKTVHGRGGRSPHATA